MTEKSTLRKILTIIALLLFFAIGWFSGTYFNNKKYNNRVKKYDELSKALKGLQSDLLTMKYADSLFVENAYKHALVAYQKLRPQVSNSLKKELERRIERSNFKIALRKENNEENQDIADYKQRLRHKEQRLKQLEQHSDSLGKVVDQKTTAFQQKIAELEKTLSQKEKALDKKENVQVISFENGKSNTIHYLGEVEDEKANGGGVGIWTTGSIYRGSWKDNKRHGEGVFQWADGEKYEGTFVNDKREGQGTYYWPSGDRYEGEWKNDRRNGQGKLYDKNGNIRYEGRWKDDKPVDK